MKIGPCMILAMLAMSAQEFELRGGGEGGGGGGGGLIAKDDSGVSNK